MDSCVEKRLRRLEYHFNTLNAPNAKNRRYCHPLSSKPVAKTLQQLLEQVVVLTNIVKSAADVYTNRQHLDELQSSQSPATAPPPPPPPPPNTVSVTSATIPPPVHFVALPALPQCEPTISSPPAKADVSKKRRRLTVSSSDSDDDGPEEARDVSSDDAYPRPKISCVNKPKASPKSVKEVFVKLTDCRKLMSSLESNPLAPATRPPSPIPTDASSISIKTDIEVDEHVWAEMLNIEDANDVSSFGEEFEAFVEKRTDDMSMALEQHDDSDKEGEEETIRYEFVIGRRIHSNLLYTLDEKQLYRRASKKTKYDGYVCIWKGCRASLRHYVKENVLRPSLQRQPHCHPIAEEQYLANKFMNTVKLDILNSDGTENTAQIYKRHAEKNAQIAKMVPLKRLNHTLRKYRNDIIQRKFIESPVTLAGVAAAFQSEATFDAFGRCMGATRSDFYRGTVVASEFGFSVFASATVMQRLGQAPAGTDRHFHVDGTMNVWPDGEYKQLLMVFWEHQHCIFPVVYVLLTKRSTAAYVALFEYIEERICNLAPTSIMCDYEFALRNALHRVYPHCIRRPSHFHLVQSARRHALSLPQFFQTINADTLQCRLFHKFMHLPLLPAEKMAEGFELLRAESFTCGHSFGQFVYFLHKKWIAVPGGPISVVSSESSASAKLVETYNAVLRPKIRPARKFFHFVDELAKDELLKADELSTGSGTGHEDGKPKSNRHANTIVRMQKRVQDGKATVAEFLIILSEPSSALNMSSVFGQQLYDVEDDDGVEMEEQAIELLFCETCGAADQRKIVLQPCGHVCKCKHCYEKNKASSCPLCKQIATGYLMY